MKISFGNLSISLKLRLIIMATSSIALLLACASFAAYDQVSTRRWLLDDISTDARIIATNVTAAVAFKDHESASEALSGISLSPNIRRARIYEENGEVFADYRREESQDNSPQPAQESAVRFVSGYLLVSEPIVLDGENIGTVSLVSDTTQLKRRLQKYIGIVGLVLFGSLIVALLISSRLQRVISGPISHLAETARAVSTEKDYSIRAARESRDETGLLIDGFNEMLVQIQARDEQLQQRNDSLQAEIGKRKSIEQALREGDERHRAFVAESSEAIWRLELEHPLPTTLSEDKQISHFFRYGYLAECNDVMARTYDRTCADEIVGTRLAGLMSPVDPDTVEYLSAFMRSGYRLIDVETHTASTRRVMIATSSKTCWALAKLMLEIRPELPVILATGYSTTINPERAKAIGIRELLHKPNTTQTLGEAVRRALGAQERITDGQHFTC